MAGWGVVGALFCGLYFYQEARFPHLWIPLVDWAAAWALIVLPQKLTARRPLRLAALAAALLVALLILRGQYRRIRDVLHHAPAAAQTSMTAQLRPLLSAVPAGAWLFTNFKPISVELARPHPGPTGSLYVSPLDAGWPLMNMHVYGIDLLGLKPKRPRRDVAPGLQTLPKAWENGPAELIGLDGSWRLAPEERQALLARPVYALVLRPQRPLDTGRQIDQRILPLLRRELTLRPLAAAGEATLYRVEPKA